MTDFDLRIARTPGDVEALREAWTALPVDNPAADPDHLLALVHAAALTVSQGGLVGAEDGRAGALLAALVDSLRQEPLDVVRLRARVGSALHKLATTRPASFCAAAPRIR